MEMEPIQKNALATLLITGSFIAVGACLAPDNPQAVPSPAWIGALALLFQKTGDLGINLLAGVVQKFQDKNPPRNQEIFSNGHLVDLVGLSVEKALEQYSASKSGPDKSSLLRLAGASRARWKLLLQNNDYQEFNRLREQALPEFLAAVATDHSVPSLPAATWEGFLVGLAAEPGGGLSMSRDLLREAAQDLTTNYARCFWEVVHIQTPPQSAARERLHTLILGRNLSETLEIRQSLTQLSTLQDARHEETVKRLQEIVSVLRSLVPWLPPQAVAEDPHLCELQAILNDRQATRFSLERIPEECDEAHRYTLVHRIDILDYQKRDFFSIRRLRGKNILDKPSSCLVYRETSEVKLRVQDVQVKALCRIDGNLFEATTRMIGRRLEGRHWRFPFRIFFPKPIMPGEDFDITYSIVLPSELDVLPRVNELMSISLTRFCHGVEELAFEVFWDFRPRAVNCAALGTDGALKPANPSAFAFPVAVPSVDWVERLNRPKRTATCGVRWAVHNPDSAAYVVHYMH